MPITTRRSLVLAAPPLSRSAGNKYDQFAVPTVGGCPAGYSLHAKSCYGSAALQQRFRQFEENAGFFPTLLGILPSVARVVFPLLSVPGIHQGAPELAYNVGTAAVGIPGPIAAAALKVGTTLATGGVAGLTSGGPLAMSINIGGVLSGIGGLLGQTSSVPVLQSIGQITQAFAPAFASGPVTPQSVGVVPVAQRMPVPSPMPMPRSPGNLMMRGRGLSGAVLSILGVVAAQLGRKHITLNQAVSIIRRMGKFLLEPAAIAVALGIGVSELAELITAHAQRPRRHMNAANPKALRRAARRIKSFHRMCGTIDLLKSRGRRVGRSTACGTCRKNPCRC